MLKKTEIYENNGLFLNMEKWCFWGLFFSGFNVIVVCFLCVCHSCKSVRNACYFPSFLGFCGVAYSCLFGFGRFRCFSGSCVWFSFCSSFFLFVLVLFLFCCWCCSCSFCFCFFLFFLEGLRVK